jgi:D-arginine dehydrogenase
VRQTLTTVVIGGGIAGLAAALHAPSDRRVIVVESEPTTFAHSSGRNAAILRTLEGSVCISALAVRSGQLLAELNAPAEVLDQRGLILASSESNSDWQSLVATAVELGLPHDLVDPVQFARLQPALRGSNCTVGVHLPSAGVLDLVALDEWLRARIRDRGVELRTGAGVREILRDGRQVRGIATQGGELRCDEVVVAAGAWSEPLGHSCGCPLPLAPHRRHLMLYGREAALSGPVAWDIGSNVYFRPAGDSVLACPGDETPHPAGLPEVDPELVRSFAPRLAQFAPELGMRGMQRAWACLRTVTPDAHPVVGPDPRLEGLYWLAGLGGVGMSAGLACAEHLGRALAGGESPVELKASRWLAPVQLPATDANGRGIETSQT